MISKATGIDEPRTVERVLFHEVQRFRQPWIWIVLIGMLVFIAVAGGYDLACRLGLLDASPSHQGKSGAPFWLVLIPIVGLLLAMGLMYMITMTTEVCGSGLYVRFFPFHLAFRRIPLEDVMSFAAVTYRPIWEYGGWGIRWAWKGKAYNVSGNRGVRLEFSNGKHLLIGSQEPESLALAIEQICPRRGL